MGWSTVQDNRHLSKLAMLRVATGVYVGAKWNSEENTYSCEMVALASGESGAYGVLHVTHLKSGASWNTALIYLIERKKGEFAWKTFSEADTPYYYAMPKRLLNMLSPPDDIADGKHVERIRNWRDAAWARHAKAAISVKAGDILEFDHALPFNLSSGQLQVTRFQVREWGKLKRFTALCDNGGSFPCRIRRDTLQSSTYKVIQAT